MNAPLNVCTHANFVMTRWCAFGLSEPSCLMRLTDNHPSHFLIKFIQNGKSTVCPLLSFSAIVSFYRFLTIEISYFLSLILRDSWFCYYVFPLKVAQEIDARTAKIDSLPRTCATFDRCVCDVSLKYVLHKAQGKKGQPFPTE